MSNVWHDFDYKRINKDRFFTYIEIPKGSKNKYEIDKETGILVLDRVLGTSMQYPANYGFIPKTLADDNDAVDVLVLCQEKIDEGCLVETRPIGVMLMNDGGQIDEKIIAVAIKDPVYSSYNELNDLPEHIVLEIKHFFDVYKAFEEKKTIIEGFKDREYATKVVEKGIERYKEVFG